MFDIVSYSRDEIDKFFREHKEDIEKLHDELFDAMLRDVATIIARRIFNERRTHNSEAGRVSRLQDVGFEQPGRPGNQSGRAADCQDGELPGGSEDY